MQYSEPCLADMVSLTHTARTMQGLSLPLDSHAPGTAVMLTFMHLSDMIDRQIKYHNMLETQSLCNYELKAVAFVHSANLNNPIFDKASQPTTNTAAVSTVVLDDAVQYKPTLSAQTLNNDDVSNSSIQEVSPDTETEPEQLKQFTLISPALHEAPKCKSDPIINAVLDETILQDISRKLSKISQQEKRKYKRRLLLSQKMSQRKENQKKEKIKYASDEMYKAKNRSDS